MNTEKQTLAFCVAMTLDAMDSKYKAWKKKNKSKRRNRKVIKTMDNTQALVWDYLGAMFKDELGGSTRT